MRNFNISDEERKSILRLHETSTKKQYLNVINEAVAPPTAAPTLIDVQNLLIGLGHKVSNSGVADGKLGPMTITALMTALKAGKPAGDNPQQVVGVNIVDELMKDPNIKAVADKLKAANIDLSKMTPEQILPKIQEIAGDLLTANPNLLPTIKVQIEKLLGKTLPDIAASSGTNNLAVASGGAPERTGGEAESSDTL